MNMKYFVLGIIMVVLLASCVSNNKDCSFDCDDCGIKEETDLNVTFPFCYASYDDGSCAMVVVNQSCIYYAAINATQCFEEVSE